MVLKSEENKFRQSKTDGVCLWDFQMLLSCTLLPDSIHCAPTLFYHCACVCQASAAVGEGETVPSGKGPYMKNKHDCWLKCLFLANNTWKINRALSCSVALGVGCCCPSRVVCGVFCSWHAIILSSCYFDWVENPPFYPLPLPPGKLQVAGLVLW